MLVAFSNHAGDEPSVDREAPWGRTATANGPARVPLPDALTWFLVCCCALSLLLGCRGVSLGMGPMGVGWGPGGTGMSTGGSHPSLEALGTGGCTHERFADPVVLIVEDVAVPVEEVGEELPQVVVIGLLEEVQPPHVAQVGGHLLCSQETGEDRAGSNQRDGKSAARGASGRLHTDRGNSRTALRSASLVWCRQFSGTSPSEYRPEERNRSTDHDTHAP